MNIADTILIGVIIVVTIVVGAVIWNIAIQRMFKHNCDILTKKAGGDES